MGDDSRGWLDMQGKAPQGPAGPSREAMESVTMRLGPSRAHRSHAPRSGDLAYEAFQQANADPALLERAWQHSRQTTRDVDTRESASFFEALAAAEKEEQATAQPAMPGMVALDDEWRPPSPSHGARMTREQYLMHVELARAQAGLCEDQPFRRAELVEPPPDDAALEEGVYARTPEAALESVWDAQRARATRVARFRETTAGSVPTSTYTQVRGQAIVDRLRGWLVRAGYTDEVYGLPPLTAQMFGEATMAGDDAETEARRATAIRRLDALFRHLSTSDRKDASQMEAWLEAHTESRRS